MFPGKLLYSIFHHTSPIPNCTKCCWKTKNNFKRSDDSQNWWHVFSHYHVRACICRRTLCCPRDPVPSFNIILTSVFLYFPKPCMMRRRKQKRGEIKKFWKDTRSSESRLRQWRRGKKSWKSELSEPSPQGGSLTVPGRCCVAQKMFLIVFLNAFFFSLPLFIFYSMCLFVLACFWPDL